MKVLANTFSGRLHRLQWGLGITLGALSLAAAGCDDGSGGRGGSGDGAGNGGKADCSGPSCIDNIPGPVDEAFCEIEVDGQGTVDLEEEYLANVIFCENGQADAEALKAMAIAARSVAYWEIGYNGSICDSTACQVFSCDGEPQAKHREAVRATRGQYLYFKNQVTYGFYVRGNTPDDFCEGGSGESHVTYNEGEIGTDVEQTELGWVSQAGEAAYGQNRGCMSQLGMQCLENEFEYSHIEILQYYYGDDIQVAQAQGECTGTSGGKDDADTTTTGASSTTTSTSTSTSTSGGTTTTSTTSDTGSRPRPTTTSSTTSTTTTTSTSTTTGDSDTRGSDTTDSSGDTSRPSESDTDGETDGDAASDTADSASGDTADTADTNGSDSQDGGDEDPYDPYGGGDDDDDGGSRGDNDPGPSPWGGGDDEDTDTDTDGTSENDEAGCSVQPNGGRSGVPFLAGLMGLLLFRTRSRRR